MTQLSEQLSKSKGILEALSAITNRRAFLMLLATLVCGVLISGLFAMLGATLIGNGNYKLGGIVSGLGALLSFLAVITGAHATGFLLTDTYNATPQRTITQALIVALATLHRVFGVLLLLFTLGIVLALVVVIALFLCKIPGLGIALYAVVFPVSALLIGAALYAWWVMVALYGPALWQGHPVIRTVSLLISIVRQRLLTLLVQTLLLGLLVGVVAGIVFGIVFSGIAMVSLLSLPILGEGLSMHTLFSFGGMGGMGSFGGGHAAAAAFGGGLLFACAAVIPMLVVLAGNIIIFKSASEGVSVDEVEGFVKNKVDAVRQAAEDAKTKLEESRQQLASKAAAPSCPACKADITAEDVFCGNCGHRLK